MLLLNTFEHYWSVLQESGSYLELCLTVKN